MRAFLRKSTQNPQNSGSQICYQNIHDKLAQSGTILEQGNE